jgi:phosphoribosylformylglycinamidine synthase PurS subunit
LTRIGKFSGVLKGENKLKWLAKVEVTLKKAILDPQGAAVESSLVTMGYENVKQVRVGKYLELVLDAVDREKASAQVEEMSRRLLSNPVIEDFSYIIQEAGA